MSRLACLNYINEAWGVLILKLYEFFKKLLTVKNDEINDYQEPSIYKWNSVKNDIELSYESRDVDLKNVTIYFTNGVITNVIPDVYNYYYAQYYIIDEKKYDSYSIESIKSIPCPDFDKRKKLSCYGTPVYYLEYILNMRASQERKKGNTALAYTLLEKSLEFMRILGAFYTKENYLRMVNWLYEDGFRNKAESLETQLESELPQIFDISVRHKNIFYDELDRCIQENTDYIFCNNDLGACAECAKYQGRIYCISGKDARFPKLPDIVYKYGGFHKGCTHSFFPYFLYDGCTIKDFSGTEHDAIVYSNRPFIDNRSAKEKEYFNQREKKRQERKQAELNKEMYYLLKEKLPDKIPKSLSAYSRMKNSNSKKFQILAEEAHSIGIDI